MPQSKYDEFKSFLNSFGCGASSIECSLTDASYDDTNNVYVYSPTLPQLNVISLDAFSDRIYRDLRFSPSDIFRIKEDFDKEIKPTALNLASADSFLIDKDGNWFFIEFKNQKVANSKDSVEKKAYQTFWWICDLLYSRRRLNGTPAFDYDNPIEFARKYITYILVVSDQKNYTEYQKMHLLNLANEKYRTVFLEKLRHYLFFDAYAMTAELFARMFVPGFCY